MDWWIWVLIAVAIVGLGWLAQRRGWIDLSDKTKRGGAPAGIIMMGVDEVFAPRKHEAQMEQERQSRLPTPAPVAGDGDKGIAYRAKDASDDDPDRFKGTIRIDLDR